MFTNWTGVFFWSWTVAPFKDPGVVVSCLTRRRKCIGEVFLHFQLELNTPGILSFPLKDWCWANVGALPRKVFADIRGVIKKYGEFLNKKNYYSKRHIAINPPQNTPPRFEHTYPTVLATFWSSSGSPLSWVSLVALSWLPRCPELIQNVYLSWSLTLGKSQKSYGARSGE